MPKREGAPPIHGGKDLTESMKEIFLFGAGLSKAFKTEMPLMSELTAQIYRYPAWKRFKKYGNIEKLLTFLSQSYPWEDQAFSLRKRADFLDLSHLIGSVISERQENQNALHPNVIKFAEYLHATKAHILTLNYDTLVERAVIAAATRVAQSVQLEDLFPIALTAAASRGGAGMWASYATESITLYKLHGSLSFFYSGSPQFYGENILLSDDPKEITGSFSALKTVGDKVPLIVPPTFDKSIYFNNETVKAFWSLASGALRESNKLIIIGYSFPSSDQMIRQFLRENGAPLTDVLIVDPDPNISAKVRRLKINSSIRIETISGSGCFDEFVSRLKLDSNKV